MKLNMKRYLISLVHLKHKLNYLMKYVNTPCLNTFEISDFWSVYMGSTLGRKVYDVIGVLARLMVFFRGISVSNGGYLFTKCFRGHLWWSLRIWLNVQGFDFDFSVGDDFGN